MGCGDGDEVLCGSPDHDGVTLYLRIGARMVDQDLKDMAACLALIPPPPPLHGLQHPTDLESHEVVGRDLVFVRLGVEQERQSALVVGAVQAADHAAGVERTVYTYCCNTMYCNTYTVYISLEDGQTDGPADLTPGPRCFFSFFSCCRITCPCLMVAEQTKVLSMKIARRLVRTEDKRV